MSDPNVFAYKPKVTVMALCVVFFGLGAVVLTPVAMNNAQGLVLNGVVTFSSSSASVFYWVLVGVSLVFVGIGFWGIWRGLTSKDVVRLGSDALEIPKKKAADGTLRLNYAGISAVETRKINGQTFVDVIGTEGKATIQKQFFRNAKTFEDFMNRLQDRLTAKTAR